MIPVVAALESNARASEVPRLIGVDALRGVASLMVLAHHGIFGHLVNKFYESGPIFWYFYPLLQGWTGVHLFLLISGFCIHARFAQKGVSRDFIVFWRRRLARLYPPFVASIVLTLACLPLRSALSSETNDILGDSYLLAAALVVTLTLLLPFFGPLSSSLGNVVYWTLALEEQLYLLYSVLLWIRRRLSIRHTVALIALVTFFWRFVAVFYLQSGPVMSGAPLRYVGAQQQHDWVQWMNLGPSRWFEWVLGAYLAELYFRSEQRPSRFLPGLGVLGLLLALATQWSRLGWVVTDMFWGIFYFCLFRLVLATNVDKLVLNPVWRFLAEVGTYSYSLYLIHEPILQAIQPFFSNLGPAVVVLPLTTLAILPLAKLFYKCFEEPAIRWSRRFV